MRSTRQRWKEGAWAFLLAASSLTIEFDPRHAHVWVGLALVSTMRPWRQAWKAAAGTALRSAVIWAGLSIAVGLLAQVIAALEPIESGRPWTGRITYLMVLTMLAGLISVLGARNPGAGAWAILMALLVLVFLIPWLEMAGRLRRGAHTGDLQLAAPWTIFYGILVIAGVTNYLPTRYGPAAGAIGAGLALEFLGVTRSDWSELARCRIWLAVAWSLPLASGIAAICAQRPATAQNDVQRLWFWFRDHWGVVWALRVQERFNRSAELARWPMHLTWFGLAPASEQSQDGTINLLPAAEATLRSLVRRFVLPERVDRLLRLNGGESCQSEVPAR
jgi:hypothetical protein